METTPIIDLTDPDTEKTETLVEKSGVRLWLQPKTWRNKIVDNKLVVILIAMLVVIFIASSIVFYTKTNKINEQKKAIAELKTTNSDLEIEKQDAVDAKNIAEDKVYTCQAAVETAWTAWDRRNALVGKIFDNLFGGDVTGIIEEDNTLMALDFLNTENCNPYMDKDKIFQSAN